jgi:hypothetical protein
VHHPVFLITSVYADHDVRLLKSCLNLFEGKYISSGFLGQFGCLRIPMSFKQVGGGGGGGGVRG